MTQHAHPSRRTLLGTAAWTAPAIIVASAAPALAASAPTGTLIFNPRDTEFYSDNFERYVVLQDASVLASGRDLPAGSLLFTISATDRSDIHSANQKPGPQWSDTDTASPAQSFSYRYLGALRAGQQTSLNGIPSFIYDETGSLSPSGGPGFVITLSAPGFTPTSITYPMGSTRGTAKRSTRYAPSGLNTPLDKLMAERR